MKKGFTLVEVMIVVIVMGILAVVALPKLFGHIAKAKAAEVPIAAGTYVKLQDAFLSEAPVVGSWQRIGYAPPGTNGRSNYFEYKGCVVDDIPISAAEAGIVGWQAFNIEKLKDCKSRNVWTVTVNPAGERNLSYDHLVSSVDCAALTSKWEVATLPEGACEASAQMAEAEPPTSSPEGEEESSSSEAEDEPESPPASASDPEDDDAEEIDCEALANSLNNNGKKNGWVCLEGCGIFVPKGTAQDLAGKNTKFTRKKVNPECQLASSASTNSSAGTSSNASSSSAQGQSSNSQQPASSSVVSGSSATSNSVVPQQVDGTNGSSGQVASSSSEGEVHASEPEPQVPTIVDQNGNQITADYYAGLDNNIVYCKKPNGQNNSKCNDKDKETISKDQCAEYDVRYGWCITKK